MAVTTPIPGFVWQGAADGGTQIIDGAGNKFIAFREFASDPVHGSAVILKVTPQGQVTVLDTVHAFGTNKVDDANICQSGSDMHITLVSHTTQGDRTFQPEWAVLPGVCTPYPHNQPQLGAAGAFVPDQQPDPVPGTPVDVSQTSIDAIASEAQDKVLRAVQHSTSNTGDEHQALASSILHWAKQAVDDKRVVTLDNVQGALYQFVMDRVYQCLTDAMVHKTDGGALYNAFVQAAKDAQH